MNFKIDNQINFLKITLLALLPMYILVHFEEDPIS